jgi:hypothetical protein
LVISRKEWALKIEFRLIVDAAIGLAMIDFSLNEGSVAKVNSSTTTLPQAAAVKSDDRGRLIGKTAIGQLDGEIPVLDGAYTFYNPGNFH